MAEVKRYGRAIVDEDTVVPPLAFLTRIFLMPIGNLLGVLLVSLPVWPTAWSEDLGEYRCKLVAAAAALLGVPIDIIFRRRRRDVPARTRWFSPYEGGTLLLVPSWITAPILAGFIVWALVRHPGP